MKRVRTFVFGLFLISGSLLTAQQSEDQSEAVLTTTVSEIIVTADSLKELKELNWNDIRSCFSENEPDAQIVIGIALDQKIALRRMALENFEFTQTGTSSEVDVMIGKAQNVVDRLIALQ